MVKQDRKKTKLTLKNSRKHTHTDPKALITHNLLKEQVAYTENLGHNISGMLTCLHPGVLG